MIVKFKSRKEAAKFLKEKGIDTSSWKEEKWQSINKSQAEIHIQAVAECMWNAMSESTPKQLQPGEYHLPFGDNMDFDVLAINYGEDVAYDMMIKIAVARCARISYETLGDNPKIDCEADIRLHDMLMESGHMSPFEHIGRAMSQEELDNSLLIEDGKTTIGVSRNFRGFIQYRSLIDNQ